MGDHGRFFAGNGPQQMNHHAQRQGIGRYFVGAHQLRNFRRIGKMTGDYRVQQSLCLQPAQALPPACCCRG
jgi:hypothetical protein